MQCFTATIAELQVGEFLITDFEVAVLDLSHINQAYKKLGLEKVLGVIGSDLLQEYNALIDYGNQTLTLRKTERSEEHTSELQSLMRISYAVFCLKIKKQKDIKNQRQKNK